MQTPEQPEWYTYLGVLLVSMFGGLVRWLNKLKDKKQLGWGAFFELLVGLISSGFVGELTWLLCKSAALSIEISIFLVANAGFAGIWAMEVYQEMLKKLAQHWKP